MGFSASFRFLGMVNMKKLIIGLSIIGCLILLVGAFDASAAKGGQSVTSSTIQDMEEQIENAEKEVDALKASLSDAQQLVKELEQAKSDLKNYVEQLDAALLTIEQNIADLEAQIAQKELDIEDTQTKLAAAIETEQNQYAAMSSRIKYVYERGNSDYISMLLQSKSPSDLLNRLNYVDAVTGYDKDMLDEYIANKEYIDMCEKQLQAEKTHLDTMKACVENEKAAVEVLIETKSQELLAYENDIENKEAAIKAYEDDIAEQTEIIKELEKAVEEEKKKLLASNGIIYDGGTFAFPLESYTRVSSEYGYRIHPILNVKQFHNGVDFAAAKGTKIYAAYDGEVVAATYSSTMGNYVMIDHGSGLFTIYMHASKLYVSKGDIVVKGEHIAAVGSTGRSTGNHLHFTVRNNGAYESPWNYLSK